VGVALLHAAISKLIIATGSQRIMSGWSV